MSKYFLMSLLCIAFFSGCSLSQTYERPVDYHLNPEIKEFLVVKPNDTTLKIKPFSGGSLAESRAIFYSKEGALLPYKYARWSETPAKRLEQIFTESLSQQNIFKGVVDSNSYALGDIFLESRILHFEQVYKKKSSSSYVYIQLRVNLVKRDEALLLGSEIFDSKVLVSGLDTKENIEAFDKAVEKILKKISEWIHEQTKY